MSVGSTTVIGLGRALLLLAASCAGSRWEKANVIAAGHGDFDGSHGVELAAHGGISGVEVGVAVDGQRIRGTGPEVHDSGVVDVSLRVSLFALVTPFGHHKIEHWFDLGGEAGAGLGFGGSDVLGRAWYGGWVELGLWSTAYHPVLVLSVHHVEYSASWNDPTVYSIGLGFAWRNPHPENGALPGSPPRPL